MKRYRLMVFLIMGILLAAGCESTHKTSNSNDIQVAQVDGGQMKMILSDSLVYLDISTYITNQQQPWRSPDIMNKFGYGVAVGDDLIITTAWNVADSALIQAVLPGQSEKIPAEVVVADYEINLALVRLDKTALTAPLTPIIFDEIFPKGEYIQSYWLSGNGDLKNSRGYMDRAEVVPSNLSYNSYLNFIAGNTSQPDGRGRLVMYGKKTLGLACWADNDKSEMGIIPALLINKFLDDALAPPYRGFGTVGFSTEILLDKNMREYLSVPHDISNGILVKKVNQLGSGVDVIHVNDVIIKINGKSINAYGKYKDDNMDELLYESLITSSSVGDIISMDIIRNGEIKSVSFTATNFDVDEMLIPYYEYNKRPEFFVMAGYVFQKLTRDYFLLWGEDWPGKVSPHLYSYYRTMSFDPTQERRDIVILSFVLPTEISLGYHQLGQMVVKSVNGKIIKEFEDLIESFNEKNELPYHVVEFEQFYPKIVIPKSQVENANMIVQNNYGVTTLMNIND